MQRRHEWQTESVGVRGAQGDGRIDILRRGQPEEQHAGRPDCRGTAHSGQHHLREHRFEKEQQERIEKDRNSENHQSCVPDRRAPRTHAATSSGFRRRALASHIGARSPEVGNSPSDFLEARRTKGIRDGAAKREGAARRETHVDETFDRTGDRESAAPGPACSQVPATRTSFQPNHTRLCFPNPR